MISLAQQKSHKWVRPRNMQRECRIEPTKRVYAGYQAEEVIGWFIRTDGSLLFSEEEAAATMLLDDGPAQVQTIYDTFMIWMVNCYCFAIYWELRWYLQKKYSIHFVWGLVLDNKL